MHALSYHVAIKCVYFIKQVHWPNNMHLVLKIAFVQEAGHLCCEFDTCLVFLHCLVSQKFPEIYNFTVTPGIDGLLLSLLCTVWWRKETILEAQNHIKTWLEWLHKSFCTCCCTLLTCQHYCCCEHTITSFCTFKFCFFQ